MRLTRSRDDVVVSGVLAGLGDYFNVDPTLLRIAFVVLAFVGVGAVIPVYIIGSIIIPKAPKEDERERRQFDRGNLRDRRNNRRPERPERSDYRQTEDKKDVSTRANEIEEDDWSDF